MNQVRIRIPKLAIAIGIVLVLAIASIIIVKSIPTEYPLSELESLALNEKSSKAINYLEEIDNGDEIDQSDNNILSYSLDRYIAFALEYNYNENDKTEISVKEIEKLLESIFDADFKTEEINGVGISPLLLDKNVTHDPVGQVYSIKPQTDKRIIADIPVTKYIENKSYANRDKTTYTVIYDKYTAKSPYDVIPHTNGEGVKDYLEGKGKIKSLKNIIDKEAAEKITQPAKQTTVSFIVKDGKILIKSIK